MKHYLLIGLVFLVVGCETIEAASDGKPPIVTETQVKKIPEPKELDVIQTAKPILCVTPDKIFSHLQSIGEIPIATWTDAIHGHPVIVFMNIEEGSSTVIEMPSFNDRLPKELACILSAGIKSTIDLSIKKDIGRPIKYLTF